jgi:maltose-binding protein MalE
MKTCFIAAAAVLLLAAGTASAVQVCGAATCTSTSTHLEDTTQGNTSTTVKICTGNIIVMVNGDMGCSGQTQTVTSCQTRDFEPDSGCANAPGVERGRF